MCLRFISQESDLIWLFGASTWIFQKSTYNYHYLLFPCWSSINLLSIRITNIVTNSFLNISKYTAEILWIDFIEFVLSLFLLCFVNYFAFFLPLSSGVSNVSYSLNVYNCAPFSFNNEWKIVWIFELKLILKTVNHYCKPSSRTVDQSKMLSRSILV